MGKKKIIFISLAVLLGFYLLTKILNKISPNVGQETYEYHCAGCHGKDGLGLGGIVPPLAQADWMEENQNKIPCVIYNGLSTPIVVNSVTYHQEMLGLNYLSEIQVTNIINYINNTWGNEYGYKTVQEVEDLLGNCD